MLVIGEIRSVEQLIDNAEYNSADIKLTEISGKLNHEMNSYLFLLLQLDRAEIRFRQGENDSALSINKSMFAAAEQAGNKFLQALAKKQCGEIYTDGIDREKSDTDLKNALSLYFEELQNSTTAEIYGYLAMNALASAKQDEYYDWLLKAQRLYDKINDKSGKANLYSNMAFGYNILKDYNQSLKYFNKSIELYEKINDRKSLAVNHLNLANLYVTVDSIELAKKNQQTGMAYAKSIDSKPLIGQATLNLALLYAKADDSINNILALQYELKAIEIYSQLGNTDLISRRYISVAILYDRLNDTASAVQYFTKAVKLSQQNKNFYILCDAYWQLCVHYKVLKDYYNAYESLKLYHKFHDSISNEKIQKQVEEIKEKYESEKKDAAIDLLNTTQRIQRLELEKKNAVINGNLLEAKQRQNEINLLVQSKELQELKIKKQESDITEQSLLANSREQLLQLALKEKQLSEKKAQNQSLIRNGLLVFLAMMIVVSILLFNRFRLKKIFDQELAIQKERMRISSDLHDDLGSGLTSINMLGEQLKRKDNPDQRENNVEIISSTAGELVDNMREIVWALNTSNDSLENLVGYIHESARKMLDHSAIKLHVSIPGQIPEKIVAGEVRRNILLAVKETINNAVRYSSAKNIYLTILNDRDKINIIVKDDGIGFEINNIRKNATGLNNIQRRMDDIKGDFNYSSQQGNTTASFQYTFLS